MWRNRLSMFLNQRFVWLLFSQSTIDDALDWAGHTNRTFDTDNIVWFNAMHIHTPVGWRWPFSIFSISIFRHSQITRSFSIYSKQIKFRNVRLYFHSNVLFKWFSIINEMVQGELNFKWLREKDFFEIQQFNAFYIASALVLFTIACRILFAIWDK